MYRTYKGLDLTAIDKEILAFWEEQDIFEKSIEGRDPENSYVFYEGPPSANGMPGIHHVMARSIKDIFCRFHTMKGKRVERKGGWDTHGLPVELAVEKSLGITKEDIGKKISIADYNAKCREAVMQFKDKWDEITRKMGYWVDLENPYITFENNYIESVWQLLRKLYDKDLIYKGYTIQPFSPAAGTGLSTHELNMPGTYKDVKDTSVTAQFKVIREDQSAFLFESIVEGDVFFLAWTTTPWTLPSNTALSVGPKISYVLVRTFNPYTKLPINVILAKDLLSYWFKPEQAEASFDEFTAESKIIPYEVLAEYTGVKLEGISYEQLLPYVQPEDGRAFVVVTGDHVTTSDGTGIVHTAPSFGADDMLMAKKHGIGSLTLVDKQGRFVDSVTDFAGMYVKDYQDEGDNYTNPDVEIAIKLKKENRAFNVQKYSHNYPHCWRTDKPVLYYPLDSWFVRTTACKERLVELNKTINWKPSHTGEKRFGNWLENLQDWNLSRSRYWGIPLPIWRSQDGAEKCIGSIEELTVEINKANEVLGLNQTVPEDLHRPYIDDVVLVSESGQKMVREADLIDVWFDSGSMPYAQWHYPFENETKFKQNYPADFIAEGVDQTRGWFFTLHAIAGMVYDTIAFKNVVSNGLVQDKEGRKMSKRLGNAVDPFQTLADYGADATRWYMISNAQPWDNLKFDLAGIEEVKRKFFGTLYNTYSFFALYANIDKFRYAEPEVAIDQRPEIDRWILSLLNTLVSEVTQSYEDYEPTIATRKIQQFVDQQLSNWYVRLCRRRFWKGDYSQDKISAYQTLYTCLVTLAKLIAPVAPFYADRLYKDLNEGTNNEPHESVHLAFVPDVHADVIDKELEQRMDYAQRISSLILSLRKKHQIRVRQPLQKVMIPILDDQFQKQVEAVQDLILSEVNVKEIEFLSDSTGVISKKIKPNFKTLGKKLGRHMKAFGAQVSSFTQEDISTLEKTGKYTFESEGERFELMPEDFVITSEDIPGWLVANDEFITVALDVTISEELKAEGTARELVNRIQNLRKDKNFEVTDRIDVAISPNELAKDAVMRYSDYICNEVLADSIKLSDNSGDELDLLDGEVIRIQLEKV